MIRAWWRGPAAGPRTRRARSGGGDDVVVPAEPVLRVVLRLDLREALVVPPVGALPHAGTLVLRDEVHVHAARGERRRRLGQAARPGDALGVLGRIAPARVHVQHELDVA